MKTRKTYTLKHPGPPQLHPTNSEFGGPERTQREASLSNLRRKRSLVRRGKRYAGCPDAGPERPTPALRPDASSLTPKRPPENKKKLPHRSTTPSAVWQNRLRRSAPCRGGGRCRRVARRGAGVRLAGGRPAGRRGAATRVRRPVDHPQDFVGDDRQRLQVAPLRGRVRLPVCGHLGDRLPQEKHHNLRGADRAARSCVCVCVCVCCSSTHRNSINILHLLLTPLPPSSSAKHPTALQQPKRQRARSQYADRGTPACTMYATRRGVTVRLHRVHDLGDLVLFAPPTAGEGPVDQEPLLVRDVERPVCLKAAQITKDPAEA